MRLQVREIMGWQIGKLYLPAVRSDKEDCVVTHQNILRAAAPGTTGLQKKDAHASTYVQQVIDLCSEPLALQQQTQSHEAPFQLSAAHNPELQRIVRA